MLAFAANSLLTRGALGHNLIDAPSFTIIRLVSGALMLAVLNTWSRSQPRGLPAVTGTKAGTWSSGASLAGYAVAFTLAYTRIGAGIGALLLFGAVQVTMIGTGVVRGERPLGRDWLGLLLAMAGLAWLTVPGATAPDPRGAALMILAGACWGMYSLAGRGSRDPLAATTGNFWRAAFLGALALGFLVNRDTWTWPGFWLAIASGAVASGLGYTIWYAVLPSLGSWRAALVQLTVPIIAAAGATIFLSESVTTRLLIAAALVIAGVSLSLRRPARQG